MSVTTAGVQTDPNVAFNDATQKKDATLSFSYLHQMINAAEKLDCAVCVNRSYKAINIFLNAFDVDDSIKRPLLNLISVYGEVFKMNGEFVRYY
jgi:hypothetical protein